MENLTINAEVNNGMKNFTFAKIWTESKNGKGPGSLIVNQDCPLPITLMANCRLNIWVNAKRDGKDDPDYTVSVSLPAEKVDQLIAKETELKAIRASKLVVTA